MRALIQRVTQASVSVDNSTISEIKQGLLILVCAMNDDNEEDADKMASKISKIRIFNDEAGKLNKSIKHKQMPSPMHEKMELFLGFS